MPLIGTTLVTLEDGVLSWTSGMSIDCDGAPRAYAPIGFGRPLDYLANAGSIGKWWGLVCNAQGVPFVQQAGDLAPGYYISPTALCDRDAGVRDPRRYVDATVVPYIALPPDAIRLGAKLGDVCRVMHGDLNSPAIVADIGPRKKIGEGSPALATALGINPSPRNGGIGAGVSYRVWCGSSQGWPRSAESIRDQVLDLEAYGRV